MQYKQQNNFKWNKIKLNKKVLAILATIIIVITAILIVYIQNHISKTNTETAKEMEYEQSTISTQNELTTNNDITNIDLTGLVTGEDVSHTHIYERKFNDTEHWEECFICGNIINREKHNLETTGSGLCGTYLITRCKDGCGYNTSQYVDHEIEFWDPSEYTTNYVTYYHTIGECKKCGSINAQQVDGTKTLEYCRDIEGNLINCSNRKKCVVCGYDYSKLARISHDSRYFREYGRTIYCPQCNEDIATILFDDATQDTSNNLHWTIKGIFQLKGEVRWDLTELATYSTALESGAFESLGKAKVTDLPAEYYNKEEYGTQGITSGLYLVTYEVYIKD